MNAKAKLKMVLDVAMTLALLPKADRAGCGPCCRKPTAPAASAARRPIRANCSTMWSATPAYR